VQPQNDVEIAERLLRHLATAFACPDVMYAVAPTRIQGGFDTAIFGFTLDHAAPHLSGPLILRLANAATDPQRVRLEAVVQNTLADMGFPAPRVNAVETDPGILGGPFMVMARLPGQTLAHGIEGLGANRSFAGRVRLLVKLPALFGRITRQWVDIQLRLHELPADRLLQAVSDAGIDARAITFAGQLAKLGTIIERCGLVGLRPALAWLEDRRPPEPRTMAICRSICHGDFHPLNILADGDQTTGVIDWSNIVIAEPAMDVGSAIANIAAVPLDLPRALHVPARAAIRQALQRYEHAYRARRPLDPHAVRYYMVFRAFAQLVWVAQLRTAGRGGRGAFNSPAGIANLTTLIRKLSGLSLRLDH
jgi:aminoglycoside phosphotransferase (APT) family kinase protein